MSGFDKMDWQCMQVQIDMTAREQIIATHKQTYDITYNEKKGRFYTRFLTDNGIVQRNRKDVKELEDLIVLFYQNGGSFEEESPDIYTFRKAHDRWLEMQEEYGVDPNTIYKAEADWTRFFPGNRFCKP